MLFYLWCLLGLGSHTSRVVLLLMSLFASPFYLNIHIVMAAIKLVKHLFIIIFKNTCVFQKHDLMKHVSHQCIVMQFILELAKSLEQDPRSCVRAFFSRYHSAHHFVVCQLLKSCWILLVFFFRLRMYIRFYLSFHREKATRNFVSTMYWEIYFCLATFLIFIVVAQVYFVTFNFVTGLFFLIIQPDLCCYL